MENQNGQQDLSQLKSMFSDYQRKQSQSKNNRRTREDILAKYFVPRATKETFRMLPPQAGRKHIQEAFFHVVTTNTKGGKKRHGTVIYCPAHNDPKVPKIGPDGKPLLDSNGAPLLVPAPCPLCEKNKAILKKQDPSIRGIKKEAMNDMQLTVLAKNTEIWKEAQKWEAKKFYIVRGIDKGKEKDGVKFWRFKHHYRNQGTLDKLLPILSDYVDNNQVDFADPVNGTDLSISMAESDFNGRSYMAITAISAKGKSPLHADAVVAQSWLNDDITWRDVFKPKQAPNMPPYEFLQSVAEGTNPYWDDTDQTNKRWVFPGRPDLEELANTRKMNLDNDEKEFEQASDLETQELPRVTISNITEDKVGEYKDNAINVGQELTATANATKKEDVAPKTEPAVVNESNDDPEDSMDEEPDGDYDDLPF